MRDELVAVIGLGYVGLPLAVELGKIRAVIGFDLSNQRIEELKSGVDKTKEVDSQTLLGARHLKISGSLEDIADARYYIVTVPTPIDNANRPNLEPIRRASTMIGGLLKEGDIVIYESTVFPGCTEEICVPILEKISGLKFNQQFYCGYSPERINPGDKINTLTKVTKITSGSNARTADKVDQIYQSIMEVDTFKANSIRVAEAAKVIENTQRDLNIALINELSVIFNRIDIDTNDVLDAAATKWNFLRFSPGMVGGHCIGVDPYYLTHKAEEVGYNPQVILAGRRINDNMAKYAARETMKQLSSNGVSIAGAQIGVWGITFKENCPDFRNTKVIDLIRELEAWGAKITVCDPWANPKDVEEELGIELVPMEAIPSLDALVVAVGHKEYREFDIKRFKNIIGTDQPFIADLKGLYDREELSREGITYFRF